MRTDKETGRSGELGELLLYMLIEWVLKAPIVASKMYLKTSQQMPVHGVDGIHLGYEADEALVKLVGTASIRVPPGGDELFLSPTLRLTVRPV